MDLVPLFPTGRDGARRGGGDFDAMTVADLTELGGSLEDLLARLANWTHRVAPQVADLPAHHYGVYDTYFYQNGP